MAAIASWRPNDPAGLEEALQLGRLQSRLELPIFRERDIVDLCVLQWRSVDGAHQR